MICRVLKFPVVFFLIFALSLPLSVGTGIGVPGFLDSAQALSAKNGPLGTNIFVEIAKRENPAVVNVSMKAKKKQLSRRRSPRRPERSPDPFRDFYDRFFGEQRERPRRGMGSGFLIDKEGYILTNYHVVEGADEILVTFQNHKEYTAKLIGSDSKTDIALIKVEKGKGEPVGFPHLAMGDSDSLEVGEWVMAIGNPFGLSHTVTVGVVSAKGRNIGAGPYDDFIQTDASINPGNSGGPLINIKGEVVGINTAIISGNAGGNVGIGFALPINIATSILKDLKEKGAVTRGWLGVMIQKITPELAKSFGLDGSEGALVGDVIPDGPADKAGIKRGDVILKFNNEDVKEMDSLPRMVASVIPGTTVPVELVSEGKNKIVDVSIEILKDREEQIASLSDQLGMQVQDITPEIAQSLNLEDAEGVLVADVSPEQPAGEAGLRRGDVITEVNRESVRSVDEYNRVLSKIKKGKTVLILIKRGGSTVYIAVKTG